jgi:hypothetical protein
MSVKLHSALEKSDNQHTGGFQYAATSNLKRITGRIFTSFNFSIIRKQKKFKTIGAYTESTDLIFKTFKKIIDLVTQSLEGWWM